MFWSRKTFLRRQQVNQKRGKGIVDPFDASRIVHSAYELSLGSEVYFTGCDTKKRIESQTALEPGQFALLITKEIVRIPPDSLGFISIKAKYKMRGIINVSGFHVDPGYDGKLMFSVYNAGSQPLIFSPGKPFFLLWIAQLDGEADKGYDGTWKTLIEIGDEEVMNLKGHITSPQENRKLIEANRLESEKQFEKYRSETHARISVLMERFNMLIGVALVILGVILGKSCESSDTSTDKMLSAQQEIRPLGNAIARATESRPVPVVQPVDNATSASLQKRAQTSIGSSSK